MAAKEGKRVTLITGANRPDGIGQNTGVKILEAHPDAVVFFGGRDNSKWPNVAELERQYPGRAFGCTYLSGDAQQNKDLIEEIRQKAGQLDTIIANAGVTTTAGKTFWEQTPDDFREHWEVNCLGHIILFQAAKDLIQASPTGRPMYVYISGASGSITDFLDIKVSAYGSSRAACNFVMKAMHVENPWLISFALNPGWVGTYLGDRNAAKRGFYAPHRPEECGEAISRRLDEATRDTLSGQFVNFKRSTKHFSDRDTDLLLW